MQHLGAQPGLWQVPLTFWNNAFMLLSSVSLPRQESTLSVTWVSSILQPDCSNFRLSSPGSFSYQ